MRPACGSEASGDSNPLNISNVLSVSSILQSTDFNPSDFLAVDEDLTQKFLDFPQLPQEATHDIHMHDSVVVKGLINQDGTNEALRGVADVKGEIEGDDTLQTNDDEEVRISEMQTTLEAAMKNVLVCLISEYLSETITLRQFLTKIRQCLCSPDSSATHKEVFTWVLRCMLEGGSTDGTNHVHRMATFLEENGVMKNEIEASSAAIKEESLAHDDIEIGDKRKRKDTKKSISRGLRSAPNKWTKAESQLLIRLVHENGDKSWKRIAEQLGGGKTGAQCAQHWKRVLSPQIKKGSWDDQEEELLLALVERYGQSWKNIAGEIKSRTDIQCRYQYQKSCLSRQCEWHEQEDSLMLKKVAQMLHEGGAGHMTASRTNTSGLPVNWVEVAKFIARAKLTKIPRTALECKQRWYIVRGNSQTHSLNTSTNSIHNNSMSMNTIPMENVLINHTNSPNISSHQFHNYTNINNTFSMVSSPYASAAVTPSF